MLAVSTLLTSVIVFWLLASIVVAIGARNINHSYPSIALFVGGVAMLAAACIGWNGDFVWTIPTPVYLSIMPISNRLDSLSAIFVGLLGCVTTAVSLYSPDYLNQPGKTSSAALYWMELFLCLSGMLGVIIGANALSFLLWGEIMTLSCLFLITTNLTSEESRQASSIYLGATRIATALLIAGFVWMHVLTNSWEFSAWKFSGRETLVPALMIFLAFSIKAGIWPFQTWLPRTLQCVPAPVAALLSGVMIETALYAILRILVMGGLVSPYIAYLMLILGVISAFWGILLAFVQQDLKALLAYSTVQNIGLIFISLSTIVLGASVQVPVVSSLGIAGTVYHCVNHGFFKSLLFLGAGAIETQAHTSNLDDCGGLGRRMPWTMVSFVIGSAAICALPPLNGFVSNWLIYQSFFQLANLSESPWFGALSIICIGVLGLVSALTLATFAKAIGVAFLGRSRSTAAENAVEISVSMRIAQWFLAVLCIIFGLAAPLVLSMIKPVCLSAKTGGLINFPIPMSIFAIGVGFFTAFLYFFWLNNDKPSIKNVSTWECGLEDFTGKMQISSAGSSDNVANMFAPPVHYHLDSTIEGQDEQHFPELIAAKGVLEPQLEFRFYGSLVRSIVWLGERMLLLHSGSVHLYFVYMIITLSALLLVGLLT
jgi:hydrogenase-4 component B